MTFRTPKRSKRDLKCAGNQKKKNARLASSGSKENNGVYRLVGTWVGGPALYFWSRLTLETQRTEGTNKRGVFAF